MQANTKYQRLKLSDPPIKNLANKVFNNMIIAFNNKQLEKQKGEGVTANDKKINKHKLKAYLSEKFNDVLAIKLTSILTQKDYGIFDLQNTTSLIDFETYCTKLETFFNRDELELKKFAFKIFDTNGDDKVSEADLFELVRMCTGLKEG